MWRSLRLPLAKSKVSSNRLQHSTSSSSGSGKVVFGLVSAASVGFCGAVVYGKYNPKFRELLQDNIPFIDKVYKLFPDDEKHSQSVSWKTEERRKDATVPGSLLKKKLDREKSAVEAPKEAELKIKELASNAQATDNLVSELVKDLLKRSDEAKSLYENAVKSIKLHTKALYDALDLPEGKDGDILWKEVKKAKSDRNAALRRAEEKSFQINALMEKLKLQIKNIDPNSPTGKIAEESIVKVQGEMQKAKNDVSSVETEAKTATEYEKLLSSSKEQFSKELQIILPNYIIGDKSQTVPESDLNVLIAHAHRRVEQLQKQLAKQQVTEKFRIDEALRDQKMKDDRLSEKKIEAEIEKKNVDIESVVADRVAALKENFEQELRNQLRRQAAAHADHIQEVLKVQEQELERKYLLDMEEKLLHQKGVFISETSGNMARLKGILAFLKARSEFDEASKKARALWLACQSMNDKIFADNEGNPCPLGKDIAAVRIAADEESEFINSVLAGIPTEAVDRGVYNYEVLKERFLDVKKICRRVALIDENNDSMYRYILSYLQSLFVIDSASIPKEELDGKIAVDPTEWDTYDVLSRISFSLKINDLELALRYANQLKGEPRAIATDWMKEVKLLLETQLAVKALLAHAVAVGVQAYH